MADKKKKRLGLGFAIWFLLFLGILILILINWKTISANFASLKDSISKSNIEKIEKDEEEKKSSEEKTDGQNQKEENSDKKDEGVKLTLKGDSSSEKTGSEKNELQATSKEEINQNKKSEEENNAEEKKESHEEIIRQEEKKSESPKVEEKKSDSESSKVAEKSDSKKTTEKTVSETRNTKLYFLSVDANGTSSIKEVSRAMAKSDSPLTDALKAIIAGPNSTEKSAGCQTFISEGTRLISASVKNGIATLNFSENLAYNSFGLAGLNAELEQIVYTATAFPTVDSVQILIEGKLTDYLAEGVWIGTPLKRSSF